MRFWMFVAVGLCLGILVAGVVNAVLITLIPEAMRSALIVWMATGAVAIVAVTASWLLFLRRRL